MTNADYIRGATAAELIGILTDIADKSELADMLCERCMALHGGNCVCGDDCSAGDYSVDELVKMWLGWEISK